MKQRNPRLGKPMILTVHLPDDIALRLGERASQRRQAIEEYVVALIERDAAPIGCTTSGDPAISSASSPEQGEGAVLSDDEFELLLNELAAGPTLPHLPADFSRADVNSDHD
jgi:hypothetical protein